MAPRTRAKAAAAAAAQAPVSMHPAVRAVRQYGGAVLCLIGSGVACAASIQTRYEPRHVLYVALAIILLALLLHETRPSQGPGWTQMDEYKTEKAKEAEEEAAAAKAAAAPPLASKKRR